METWLPWYQISDLFESCFSAPQRRTLQEGAQLPLAPNAAQDDDRGQVSPSCSPPGSANGLYRSGEHSAAEGCRDEKQLLVSPESYAPNRPPAKEGGDDFPSPGWERVMNPMEKDLLTESNR